MNSLFTRRQFMWGGVCAAAAAGGGFSPMQTLAAKPGSSPELVEVMFYKKLAENKIECGVCPKRCKIAPLERGYCGNKENREGKYYTLVYGAVCAAHVDPIEKKPLFHYLPGSPAFSIATAGCNFECRFCQNWQIAQYRPEQVRNEHMPPERVVELAGLSGSRTIAYTYSEPVVFYTFMYDTARLARRAGIGSVMISNGYILPGPMEKLCEVLTGVKIDLKAFTEKFYKNTCSGELKPVLETLKLLKRLGMWTEIVVLIVPTLNDGKEEIKRMCRWILDNLGPDVPVHFTRFHPSYKIKNLPPTPLATLETAHRIGRETGLHYVYLGNVWGHPAENTYCPKCGKIVIRRIGYKVAAMEVKGGKCKFCGFAVAGVWNDPAKRA
ncbi:MAG: AmmeMemoRadiSam system radical SAM enzyme [Deltaproteobacteria bacterium]|nr:AmmeMemoRadiSam system radical SAM enzyme [Deltaproteobacteria bacterium]